MWSLYFAGLVLADRSDEWIWCHFFFSSCTDQILIFFIWSPLFSFEWTFRQGQLTFVRCQYKLWTFPWYKNVLFVDLFQQLGRAGVCGHQPTCQLGSCIAERLTCWTRAGSYVWVVHTLLEQTGWKLLRFFMLTFWLMHRCCPEAHQRMVLTGIFNAVVWWFLNFLVS